MTETVLEEAIRITGGDRQRDYSHPLDDWTCTGRLFGALIDRWLRCHHPEVLAPGAVVPDMPAELALLMMEPVKLSREFHQRKRDNAVDGAGYWSCSWEAGEERARRDNL
jgi:hypothetical protein